MFFRYLKVAFLPNYNVSNAQIIIPASDVSQHISTAGTEASGTSNMKFVMNGGLIIGTMDGANVEIREECGSDCLFVFGAREHEVSAVRARARVGVYPVDPRLQAVFDVIKRGDFCLEEEGDDAKTTQSDFDSLISNLDHGQGLEGDKYLVVHDWPSYLEAQKKLDETYKNKELWWSLSIKAACSMGKFSTDRTIEQVLI